MKAAANAYNQSGQKAEDANKRHNKSCVTVKRLEGDVVKLMSQVTTLEHANRFPLTSHMLNVQSALTVTVGVCAMLPACHKVQEPPAGKQR